MPDRATALSEQIQASLGMLIPVWFPPGTPPATMRELLSLALSDVELFVRMENVLLQVDGCPPAAPVVEELRGETEERLGQTFEVSAKEDNLGKGGAVALGFERLLERPDLQYLCIQFQRLEITSYRFTLLTPGFDKNSGMRPPGESINAKRPETRKNIKDTRPFDVVHQDIKYCLSDPV